MLGFARRLPQAVVLTAKEVALGMAYLHVSNILHGDLKPANVLLRSSRSDLRGFVTKISDVSAHETLNPNPKPQTLDPRP